MSNTATKKKNTPAKATEHELDLERYDRDAQAVAEAEAKAASGKQAIDDAEEAADLLRIRLRQGDESVKGADLAAADADVERATLLAGAFQGALRKALRNALVRPTLALAVAPLLEEAFRVDVTVLDELPTTIEETPVKPYMLLRQRGREHRDLRTGAISTGKDCTIEVIFVRSRFHASPDWDALEPVARERSQRMATLSRAGFESGEVVIDEAIVNVDLAFDQPHMILTGSEPTPWNLKTVGASVAGAAQMKAEGVGADSHSVEVASHQVSGDGKITTVIRGRTTAGLTAGYEPHSGTGKFMVRALTEAIQGRTGAYVTGIGKVTKAEVVGDPKVISVNDRTLGWKLTFEAVTPKAAA